MKKMLKAVLTGILVFVCYVVIGAVIPYVRQPKITDEALEGFDVESIYRGEASKERAMIISDNEEALKERIRLISRAEDRVILSTFEFDSDESGKDMLAALQAAADRGVQVTVLADGMPSFLSMRGNPYFEALAEMDNVEIRRYNPANLLTPWKLMGRLHDKYLIVDRAAYIMGGRNTYDYFLGEGNGHVNYDWDVLVYCGGEETTSLSSLEAYYEQIWNHPDCKELKISMRRQKRRERERAGEELRDRYERMQTEHGDWFAECDYRETAKPTNGIWLLTNPTEVYAKEPVVYAKMTQLMQYADEEVRFHTPYIVCNDWMTEQLKGICESVEHVTMMTNSVANNGNPFGAMDYAKHKEEILDTGVQILEYDGGVSYHGKCFTIDDNLAGVGSFNWDMRSAYLDTEMMLVINSEEVNADLKREMMSYEERALYVVDASTSIPPEGEIPREVSGKKAFIIRFLQIFGGWARFLM